MGSLLARPGAPPHWQALGMLNWLISREPLRCEPGQRGRVDANGPNRDFTRWDPARTIRWETLSLICYVNESGRPMIIENPLD